MRLVFAGTPEFARLALTALHQAGHEIVAVLTQPDRVSGRGLELSMSPVEGQSRTGDGRQGREGGAVRGAV